MIVLVSDLHLADDPARSTINAQRLLDRLYQIILGAREAGVRETTLVLLGDIFEILRSEIWIKRELRPWQDCADDHIDAVAEIAGRIIAANGVFFDRLAGLARQCDSFLQLIYIPGNHDRALNTKMGTRGRELIRSKLPSLVARDGRPPKHLGDEFPGHLVNEEHGLVARHGHEFDPANRYEEGLVALGDAVVVEFVQRLPMRVREALKLDDGDDSLDFLHEMDNVRPHSPKVLMDWLDINLAGKGDIRPHVIKEIDKALGNTLAELFSLNGSVPFGSFAGVNRSVGVLLRALKVLSKYRVLRPLARALPGGKSQSPYPTLALNVLHLSHSLNENFRYFVCGHTHVPVSVPLTLGQHNGGQIPLYFNTGTWRRVHRIADGVSLPGQVKVFSCEEQECVVIIYSRDDQKLGYPPHEFSRVTTAPYI
jgi:UDP-2,3-diacylglucosamine pyrophosphatase LpxH